MIQICNMLEEERLAFAKGSIVMTVGALMLIDTPTANCVFPIDNWISLHDAEIKLLS